MNTNFVTTNNVTFNTMRKLITIFTVIFTLATLATLAGCDETTGTQTSTTTPDSAATTTPPDGPGFVDPTYVDAGEETDSGETLAISFEMPEGWDVNGNSATLYEQPEDSAAGYVEVEVYIKRETDTDAQKLIKDMVEADVEENNPTYKEIVIGGKNIYVEEERTSKAWGAPWWSSYMAFEHDGWVVTVWMSDRIENRKEAINKLINTLKITTQ